MKIQTILNNGQPVKTGTGKKGPWERYEVELDSGDTAVLFGPVAIGMDVETYDDPGYGLQYRTKRVSFADIQKQLHEIAKQVLWIVNKLSTISTPPPAPGSGYAQAQNTAERLRRPRPTDQPSNPLPTGPLEVEQYNPGDLNGLFDD